MKTASPIKRRVAAIAVGAALLGAPLAAWADLSVGDSLGTTDAEIRLSLENLGYAVEEIEREDGEIEAEVTLNGVEFELEIDPATGMIAEIEQEDD